MILLQARIRLFVGIFSLVLILVLLPCPVYASSQEAETLPLTISNVSASSISYYSATISWGTNDNATSQVFYDTTSHDTTAEYAYHTTEDTDLVTEHSIPLTGLFAGTTYHYRVRSAIPDTESIAISEDYTFKTLSPPPPPSPPPSDNGEDPTYSVKTDLFGVGKTFYTSYKGKVRKTIEATSEDGMLTFTIPKGTTALGKDGKRLKSLEAAVDESPPDPPEDAHIIGLTYGFGPDGATFDPPITFTWCYDPDALPDGVAEEDMVLAYYDDDTGVWVELECEVDTENNIITAKVTHFTIFALLGKVLLAPTPEPAPAAFSVSNLTVQPLEVQPREVVTITVSVANTGGTEGSYTVVLKLNGVKTAGKSVTIAAGKSQDVSFSVTKEDAGSYSVAIDGLSGSFTVVAPVIIAPPAPVAFSVSALSILPAEVELGGQVTISIVVANTGGTEGSYSVVLMINGVKEIETSVTVAAGSSRDVSFTVSKDAGSYSVAIDGLSGSFTVVAPPPPPPPPPLPAAFSLSNLTVQPASVKPGESVVVSVSVTNTGGTEGSYSVILKINDVKETEESVTVAAGESQDVSFSVTRKDAGIYSVAVNGLSGSFTVVAPAKPPINWPVIAAIIAGAILVALLIVYVVRRRRAGA